MSTVGNIAVLEQARQQWNTGNLEGYLQLYHPTCVLYGSISIEADLAAIRRSYQEFWAAFPGSQLLFEDLFAAEDRVACRFVVHATHRAPFAGINPIGKSITLHGITILRFMNGKCIERWTQASLLSLMQQLQS